MDEDLPWFLDCLPYTHVVYLIHMTAREMQDAIGQMVMFVATDSLKFACRVADVKMGYGKPRFLIVPLSGIGEQWVEFTSIEPMPQVKHGVVQQQAGRPQISNSSSSIKRY